MMIFNELRKHGRLAAKRHPMYEKNKVAKILGYVMAASLPCLRSSLSIIIYTKEFLFVFFRHSHNDLNFVVLFQQLGKEVLYFFGCNAVD